MYSSGGLTFFSREREIYGFTEHFKRPAFWLVLLAVAGTIILSSLDLEGTFASPVLLLSLNSVFIGIPSILISIIAARGFLRTGSWAVLWMGIGSLAFGLTMVLSSVVLFWSTTSVAETTHNIGSLLTALLYVIGPLFIISNIPSQEVKPGRRVTVANVYLGVLVFAIITGIIIYLGLFPVFLIQAGDGTFIRQIILGTAMFIFLLSGALLLRHYLRFKSDLIYWYALGLLTMSLAMACRLMQLAPWTPLNWMGRGAQVIAGVYLLTAVVVTLGEARARRMSLGEALASFFSRQETNLKLLFERVAEAIIVTDRNLIITGWNKAAADIYGWKEEEVSGKHMDEVLQTRYLSGTAPDFLRMGTWKTEVVQKNKDGGERVILSSVSTLKDDMGRDSGLVAVNHDITERKQAEEAIARARDELEVKVKERTAELLKANENLIEVNRFNSGLLENSPFGIAVLDPDGAIIYANPQTEKLLGYPVAEILGQRPPYPWYPEEKYDDYLKMMHTVMAGEVVKAEKLFIKKNGKECWADTTNVPVVVNEKTRLILAIAEDITEQKRLRDELKLYSQRIIQIQEEERKHVARELHEDTAQSLAILKMELEAIIDSGSITDEKSLNRLIRLIADTERAIQDIRRYSYELRPGELDYLGLVVALNQLIYEITGSGEPEISFRVTGEERKLGDDEEMTLFRITQEALNNARKHAQATKASVKIEYLPEKIKLTISDNGKGFNLKEEAESALKRGSLGIIGMRERANLIGADFKIESEPGKGTTVTVELKSHIKNSAVNETVN